MASSPSSQQGPSALGFGGVTGTGGSEELEPAPGALESPPSQGHKPRMVLLPVEPLVPASFSLAWPAEGPGPQTQPQAPPWAQASSTVTALTRPSGVAGPWGPLAQHLLPGGSRAG